MKMEAAVSVTAVIQKVKVKEEVTECCGTPLSSSCPCPCTIVTTNSSRTLTSTPTPTTTVNNNPEPSPVNLNLKPRCKAQNLANQSKESSMEEGSVIVEKAEVQLSNGSRAQQDSTGVTSRSPDSESPLLLQSLRPENGTCNGAVSQDDLEAGEGSDASIPSEVRPGICGPILGGHGKLKRLLGTLIQFANDISPETGDTVRALVLSLMSGSMTVEEFHTALQDATNFPLRGFVLPYLKHTLPSLQRDLSNTARANNQTSVQYLRSNEAAVLDVAGFSPAGEVQGQVQPEPSPAEVFGERNNGSSSSSPYTSTSHSNTNCNNSAHPGSTTPQHTGNSNLHHYPGPRPPHALKRRASDTPHYENGTGQLFEDVPLYGKRSMNSWTIGANAAHHHQQQQADSATYCWYQPVPLTGAPAPANHPHNHSSMPPSLVQINHPAAISSIVAVPSLTSQQQHQHVIVSAGHSTAGASALMQNGSPSSSSSSSSSAALDDEWKNINVMLNCILSMVEKTKRALAILQRRGCPSPAVPLNVSNSNSQICSSSSTTTTTTTSNNSNNNNGSSNTTGNGGNVSNGSQADPSNHDRDSSLKRISGEIVAQTIRATEDKVAEVKRRAEEAVQEVKRAAVAEVQRAVAAAVAESRAAERLRVHRLFDLPFGQRPHGGHGHGHSHAGSLLHVTPCHSTATATETATCTSAGTITISTSTTRTTTPTSTGGNRDDSKETSPITGSNCWNCGRPALETCGGCGVARYCGSFCQHRDWEAGGHHATCNSTTPRPVSRSPTATSTAHPNKGK